MRRHRLAIVMAVTALAVGCAFRRAPDTAVAAAVPAAPPPAPPATTVPAPQPSPDEARLREQITALQLSMLEKDAEIARLEHQLERHRRLLDEAIQEVVRSKSKLRSLDSRAEAAAGMAEAEIALETAAAGRPAPELDPARQLLRSAGLEFEKGNFGGALYLTGQAKNQLQLARPGGEDSIRIAPFPGEDGFPEPRPMAVTTRSNLRIGPGTEYDVVTVLDPGTAVVGYSHVGSWVRVRTADEALGWIHEGLLSGR